MPRHNPRSVLAWAAVDGSGQIMPNSVADTAAGVRLKAGECKPIRVQIVPVEEKEDG